MAPRNSKKDEGEQSAKKSGEKDSKSSQPDKDKSKEKKRESKSDDAVASGSKDGALAELVTQAKVLIEALQARKDDTSQGDVDRMFRKRNSSDQGDSKLKKSKYHQVSESESDSESDSELDSDEEVSTDMDIEFTDDEGKDTGPRYKPEELMLKLPRAELLAKACSGDALSEKAVSESLQAVLQAMLLKADESRGPKIDDQLVELINKIWRSSDHCELLFENLESRIKQPANVDCIRYITLNPLVKARSKSNKFVNGRDIALSAIQKCMVKGGQALCILMDKIASSTSGQDRKDLLNFACDALDCVALASGKLSMSRQFNLKNTNHNNFIWTLKLMFLDYYLNSLYNLL